MCSNWIFLLLFLVLIPNFTNRWLCVLSNIRKLKRMYINGWTFTKFSLSNLFSCRKTENNFCFEISKFTWVLLQCEIVCRHLSWYLELKQGTLLNKFPISYISILWKNSIAVTVYLLLIKKTLGLFQEILY